VVAKEKRPLTCACGSGVPYDDCCGRYHGGAPATNAEAFMRSRYTAYAIGLEDYLLASWHPSTRPAGLGLKSSPQAQWIGLQVKSHQLLDENHATVEFVARYKINGRAYRMQEISRFVREEGRWFYVDGEQT
jgi:SEC-C motif-containing protein